MSKFEFIYGYQSVKDMLHFHIKRVQRLYLQQERSDERVQALVQEAKTDKIEVTRVSRVDLDKMLGTTDHQGIAIQCRRISALPESTLMELLRDESKPILLLILDGIQDPHNLGACIRTANAMGVDAVIAPKDRAVGLTDVVHKTACGATAITPFIQVTNLARSLREMKEYGVWLVGMDAKAQSNVTDLSVGSRVGLIMGGEAEGLRRLSREQCDYLVRIPLYGTVASLNVSVATAIGLYELKRTHP